MTPIATATIATLVLACALPGCLVDISGTNDFVTYLVVIRSSGPCNITVPIPINDELVSAIKVLDGTGDFSFVDTPHGKCAHISTSSYMKLRGSWVPEDDTGRRLLTPNLTTMDPDEVEPYAFQDRELPDRHIWIELPFPFNASLSLESQMSRPNGIDYSFKYGARLDQLEVGWNEVLALGSTRMINAP